MIALPQAFVLRDSSGPRIVARSPGFDLAIEEQALKLAVNFGPRPVGILCREAVVCTALNRRQAFFGRVSDRPAPPEDRDPPLGFHLILVDRSLRIDPFHLLESVAHDWPTTSDLPLLSPQPVPRPRRTVAELQALLKAGDGPLLLGGVQALLDGCHLAIPWQDADTVRQFWQLLPESSRGELLPATLAFSTNLKSDVIAVPGLAETGVTGFLAAEQVRDYPPGRYELALQLAVENGRQDELNRLFDRRSSSDTLRLALTIVIVMIAIVIGSKLLF